MKSVANCKFLAERMSGVYQEIIESTVKIINTLPMPVPKAGRIAGVTGALDETEDTMFQGDNYHYPMGTAYLKYGLCGVAAKAKEQSAHTADLQQAELLYGIFEVYTAIAAYCGEYAKKIEEAMSCGDWSVKDYKRLRRIANNLKALSVREPQHFDEAMQLMYLMWKLRTLKQSGSAIGRMDVRLRPYFEKDFKDGYLTEKEALELICDFWELLNENAGGDTLNNVMLGGKNTDGSDAGGKLAVLMLKATALCGKPEPHVNVRVHSKMSREMWDALLDVQFMGQGQATIYNDEVVIPSLIQWGIPSDAAHDYTNDGCTEILLDGLSGIDFTHIDAVGAFELAFYNGEWAPKEYAKPVKYWHRDNEAYLYTPDADIGYQSGEVECCESFEDFYQLFLKQYRHQTLVKAGQLVDLHQSRMGKESPGSSVLLNGSFEFVLESGIDICKGGFPYPAYMVFSGSIPTVADILVGLKEVVFERKEYSIAQVKEALRADFQGYEEMRQKFLAADKFGNDMDDVDLLAADIAKKFCGWLKEYSKECGLSVLPALVGWRFVQEAYGVLATPDGRRYGDPIAEHYCATPGRAVNGPTALINSVAKAKGAIEMAAGVCAVQISLPRRLCSERKKGILILESLIRTAIDKGLNELNIAIYDNEILKEAQKKPEQYGDVVVRVWGYSARFVELSREMQEHVISRTES